MPQQIDREGTYKGTVVEHSVSTTKNGFPQLVLRAKATEMYDEQSDQWIPWAEYDMEMVGFIVLFGNKGVCLSHTQVQKAFGWDGVGFAGLDEMDLSNTPFQFTVAEETYEGITRLKMKWIDSIDATPGQSLKKLDKDALSALDKKYGGGKATTPATPPKGKPATPPTATPPPAATPPAAEAPTPDPTPAAAPTAAEPTATAAGNAADESTPTTPLAPATPPKARARARGKKKGTAAKPQSSEPNACSKQDAWTRINEFKTESVTDEVMSEAWINAIADVAGADCTGDDITPEQWAEIRDKTLDNIDHIPF